jgi:hypothetical protein
LTNKINFAIGGASMVKEDPKSSFSILQLDFFSSGKNLNNTYVSEETLRKTASTIKNCPLVWKFEELYNDIGTHDKNEVPCGFVPETSKISEKKLSDGRIMLSVNAYVWKRYSGKILSFFKRDGDKPVSVEVIVFEIEDREDGYTELLDFEYQAITILGSKVSPAVPLARATVLQFAKEYKEALLKEFSYKYSDIDFSIPDIVKENASKGLDLYNEYGRGGSSISLALARHLINNEKTNDTKIRHMCKVFSGKKFNDIDKDMPSDSYISFMLYGSIEGKSWSSNVLQLLNDADSKHISYFEGEDNMPYKKLEDINPALKGIEPSITLGQANEIAKQADAIGVDEDKNGWAIAIANFKKTHEVIDDKWVKKDKDFSAEDDLNDEADDSIIQKKEDDNSVNNKDVKFSLNSAQITEILNNSLASYKYGSNDYRRYWVMAYDEQYAYIDDSEESKTYRAKYVIEDNIAKVDLGSKEEVIRGGFRLVGEDIEMSINKKVQVDEILDVFSGKEEDKELIKTEFNKEDTKKDFSVIINLMYAKIKEILESNKSFSTENAELKVFKEDIEKEKFNREVDFTLAEIKDAVEIPDSALTDMKEKSVNYNLSTIDAWRNSCKADAFNYAVKKSDENSENKKHKYGFPFVSQEGKKSIWDEIKNL